MPSLRASCRAWGGRCSLTPPHARARHRPPTAHHHPYAAGNYCQDVAVTKGAQYKLSYYYGRLMTFKKG
jgi:hypothetical protein